MDDETFNGILDTMREMNAAPETEASVEEAPSSDPMLSEAEAPAESSETAVAAAPDAAPEDESDPTTEWETIRQDLQAQAQREREARLQAQAELQARNRAEQEYAQRIADQEEAQYLLKLHEEDPELANQYRQHRGRLGQQLAYAQVESEARTNALHAMTLAAAEEFGDEGLARFMQRAQQLAALPSADAMQQTVEARKQAKASDNKRIAELESAVRTLTAKLSAGQRDPRADAVEAPIGGPSTTAKDPSQAKSVDELFAIGGWNPWNSGAAD